VLPIPQQGKSLRDRNLWGILPVHLPQLGSRYERRVTF
jgi:hypothetical protein